MIRRPRRTVPAVMVALLVLLACVAVAVSLIQRLTGTREFLSYDSVARYLHDLTWDDALVAAVASGIAVLGVLLLAAALLPGRATVLPLRPADDHPDGIDAGVRRKDLSAMLGAAATSIAGVESAQVKIRRHKVRVRARTDLHDNHGLPERICEVVGTRVRQVGYPARKVRARLRTPGPTARDRPARTGPRRTTAAGPGTPVPADAVSPGTGGA